MKALVLAAAIAAAHIEDAPLRRSSDRDGQRRAERKRFSDEDLHEMFGDMEPAPEPRPPLVLPEPDFIRWEPTERREIFAIPPHGESIAA